MALPWLGGGYTGPHVLSLSSRGKPRTASIAPLSHEYQLVHVRVAYHALLFFFPPTFTHSHHVVGSASVGEGMALCFPKYMGFGRLHSVFAVSSYSPDSGFRRDCSSNVESTVVRAAM